MSEHKGVSNLPNLPQPSQQLTLVTRTAVIRTVAVPLCGGVDTISGMDVTWIGGNPYDIDVVAPTANNCCRPVEPDKVRKVED